MSFGFEIDFLIVGDGERSGDAIAMRYGEPGAYFVHVVDGGNADAGDRLVDHIRTYYETTHVNAAVLTHADDDHSSGLRRVLERCSVGALVMNRPWLHAADLVPRFRDSRWTTDGLSKRLRSDFPILTELEEIATRRGTVIYDAFAGVTIADQFTILAPSRERYLGLVPQFSRTPPPLMPTPTARPTGLMALAQRAATAAAEWVQENWLWETLREDSETSASNESSVVQLGNLGGHKVLLTGDAGIQALTEAATNAYQWNLGLPGVQFMQVPHHGSRHNVSPSVLNWFLGPPVSYGSVPITTAYASVGPKSTTHPRRVVTNAFLRRGAPVFATRNLNLWYRINMPSRATYGPITSVPFSNLVEGHTT